VTEMKDIPGFPGYKATVDGKIWSDISGRFLRGWYNEHGYPIVTIKPVCGDKGIRVHRLIGLTYLEKPEGCDVINHLDNNPKNNHVKNLEWTTQKGNMQHCAKQGRAIKRKMFKLSEDIIPKIWAQYHLPTKEIAEMFNVSPRTIRDLFNGKQWSFTSSAYSDLISKPKRRTRKTIDKKTLIQIFERRAKDNSSCVQLAKEFNIDTSQMSKILLGKVSCPITYPYVTPKKWPRGIPTPPNVDTSDWGFS
jgi:hypothetical protein